MNSDERRYVVRTWERARHKTGRGFYFHYDERFSSEASAREFLGNGSGNFIYPSIIRRDIIIVGRKKETIIRIIKNPDYDRRFAEGHLR